MCADRNPIQSRALAIALALGLMHAVVDAACIGLLFWSTRQPLGSAAGEGPVSLTEGAVWNRFLLYGVLAFGTQFAIGALVDRWRAYWIALSVGLALVASAIVAEPISPVASIVAAALGNAAFHVGAGGMVLRESPERAAPSGLFVGPGAIGVAVGIWCARSLGIGPLLFLGPLALCGGIALALRRVSHGRGEDDHGTCPFGTVAAGIGLTAMLVAVAIRSFVGQGVSAVHEGDGTELWALAIAASVGNVMGGFLADRLGWVATCLVAIFLSAPLLSLFVGNGDAAVTGMVLFQMTMPVTLMAVYRIFPSEPGFAFGLGALAVLLGALPFYIGPIEHLTLQPMLFALAMFSVIAVLAAVPIIAPGTRGPPRTGPAGSRPACGPERCGPC